MARSTRAAVSGSTPGSPLTTRDTVIRLTPAAAATSRMVGRLFTAARLSASQPPASCQHENVINLLPRSGSHFTAGQHGTAGGSRSRCQAIEWHDVKARHRFSATFGHTLLTSGAGT